MGGGSSREVVGDIVANRVPGSGRRISRFPRGGRTASGLWCGRSPGESVLILLDTNVTIHYLKGDTGIHAAIRNTALRKLALPAIVVYELEYGALRSGLPARRRH